MFDFLRSDLTSLTAYQPHPGGQGGSPHHDLIDRLDTNENPYDLLPELKHKLALIYQHEIESNRYPDGAYDQLKSEIVSYIKEHSSTEITTNHISIGNGSDELIRSLLIATCLGTKDQILVADPTFSMYGIIAQTLGIGVSRIERNNNTWEIDLKQAQQAIATQPIRLIFVVHPNSPTANILTTTEIEWLKSLPDNILIVIDEAYFEFSQTTLVDHINNNPNWVILRTFSKAFRLASHRVGYAIAHPTIIQVLEKIRLPYNLPSYSQIAALLTLTHRPQLLQVIKLILAQRSRLMDHLTKLPKFKVFPSQANFIYLTLNTNNTPTELAKIASNLKERGTLIRQLPTGLRITIGTPDENNRTIDRFASI